MILLLDNYDSFTHNLVQALGLAGADSGSLRVVRNDALTLAGLTALQPSKVVISPGPGHPRDAGVCAELLSAWPDGWTAVPLLGVCLGHQALALHAGAEVRRSPRPVHGRAVAVHHDGSSLFAGIPSPFDAALYHSLHVVAKTLPAELLPCAWNGAGDIMALRHATQPRFGVQFHPESFLTPHGVRLLRNFLES